MTREIKTAFHAVKFKSVVTNHHPVLIFMTKLTPFRNALFIYFCFHFPKNVLVTHLLCPWHSQHSFWNCCVKSLVRLGENSLIFPVV